MIEDYQSSFPLPYVLVVLGYAFILLIDRVVVDSHSAIDEIGGDHEHGTETNSMMGAPDKDLDEGDDA